MGNITSKYFRGLKDVFNFFEMLYSAMQSSMPGAVFSTTGCMWWRGYRIDAYKNLAGRQYYCQIYTGNPNRLVFEEAYNDPEHPPLSKDIEYSIIRGTYFYPFVLNFDLYNIHFFHMTRDDQFQTLKNFVFSAAEQAQLWQDSSARAIVTNPKFRTGNRNRRHTRGDLQAFDRISVDFLDVFQYQYDLLLKLKATIEGIGTSVVGKEIESIRPNKSWQNWDFRGWRLKFKGLNPGSHADFLWEIYYNKPERLICFAYDGRARTLLGFFDIVNSDYFDLTDELQKELIRTFVEKMLIK